MTDLNKFIELYKSVGINLTPSVDKNGNKKLTLIAHLTNKIDGYIGFETILLFDKNEKFIKQEIYE